MFNGIKGLEVVAAKLGTTLEEVRAKEVRKEKMRALGVKGNAAKRAKEDPIDLALKARAAGCNDAKTVAAWIARYKKAGTDAANAGPKPLIREDETKKLTQRQAHIETQTPPTFITVRRATFARQTFDPTVKFAALKK